MSRERVDTSSAPRAIGRYSQAIRCRDTIYVSGQLPLDPSTGQCVEGDTRAQVRRVFDNLQEIARAAGSGLH